MWLDGLDLQDDEEPVEAVRSQYCTQQLTAEDYAATFVTTSGEFPGLLLMMLIIDRIGRRATMGLVSNATAAPQTVRTALT